MSEEKNKTTREDKKKRGTWLNYILGGLFMKSGFIRDNSLLIGLIVLFSFIYVSTRYEYRNEIMRINKLTEIRDEKANELIIVKADFAEKSKRSRIEELIDTFNIDVKASREAPYKIGK